MQCRSKSLPSTISSCQMCGQRSSLSSFSTNFCLLSFNLNLRRCFPCLKRCCVWNSGLISNSIPFLQLLPLSLQKSILSSPLYSIPSYTTPYHPSFCLLYSFKIIIYLISYRFGLMAEIYAEKQKWDECFQFLDCIYNERDVGERGNDDWWEEIRERGCYVL